MFLADIDDDLSLIRLARKGDRLAVHSLYSRHVKYLTAICSRYIFNVEDVRDVLQNSFLKIFSQLDVFEYRGKGSLRAWMVRIVINESLKFLKSSNRITFEDFPDEFDIAEEEPEMSVISSEQIYNAIRELPDGYRTIFNLYVIEEKSHKDIAALLGIKENTSASQLHRAKILLAKKLKTLKQ